MAGKGSKYRPVHLPTYRKQFDKIEWPPKRTAGDRPAKQKGRKSK
jgi:hypothetical protein